MDNLKDFMQEWQALHPPPQTQAADNKWLRFGLGLAVICSFVVSAHRTVEAFGGDIWAVFAVGMVELVLIIFAFGLSTIFESNKTTLIVGSIVTIALTFVVTIGSNVFISLQQSGFESQTFSRLIAILTGIIAPLTLFTGMELLASFQATQDKRVRGRVAKWEAERAKAWTLYRAELNGQQPAQISAPAKGSHSKNINAGDEILNDLEEIGKDRVQELSLSQLVELTGHKRSTLGVYRKKFLENGYH
jgi:hypothetical protein